MSTRRYFLATVGAFTGRTQQTSADDHIRFVLIGAGGQGQPGYAPRFRSEALNWSQWQMCMTAG